MHGIVTQLGGAIDVASHMGKGSIFTVCLPRSDDATLVDDDDAAEPPLPRGRGQRVLVVDDEEPLVRLTARTLEQVGYLAVSFTSGAAVLAEMREHPRRFAAMATDERTPGMSRCDLTREVRGMRRKVPILLVSGYVGGLKERARAACANNVLKKPLSARDLARGLARVLEK